MSQSTEGGRGAATRAPRRGQKGRGQTPRGRGPRQSPWWALLFVGPVMVLFAVLFAYPFVRTVWLSFLQRGPFGGYKYIGLKNYRELISNSGDFLAALGHTVEYSLIALLGIPIAAVIATLLNTKGLRGKSVYRTLYYLPVVTLPAVVGMVWRLIYNGDYGILNQLLGIFGLSGRSWVSDPKTIIPAVAVVAIWAGLGTNIIILLAGLQSIPETLYEAATLDGAGRVKTFLHVTLPLLSPTLFLVTVMGVIGCLQVFDLFYVMMGGGFVQTNPAGKAATTIMTLFYQQGFGQNRFGYAATIGLALMVLILALTILQFRLQRRWVHYE
ncbi:MAG: sugar ABC transporter permease [Propionibacteriaceae bacterium]|jgi:multiple sugar transport system permease protein|nr:sugar ABC transporter permease [Propionibacteriaceae bacterium]